MKRRYRQCTTGRNCNMTRIFSMIRYRRRANCVLGCRARCRQGTRQCRCHRGRDRRLITIRRRTRYRIKILHCLRRSRRGRATRRIRCRQCHNKYERARYIRRIRSCRVNRRCNSRRRRRLIRDTINKLRRAITHRIRRTYQRRYTSGCAYQNCCGCYTRFDRFHTSNKIRRIGHIITRTSG